MDTQDPFPPDEGGYRYGPTGEGGSSGGRGISRRGWIILAVLLGVLIVAAVIAAGIVVDKVLFSGNKKSAKEFKLDESVSYLEALSDVNRYYFPKEYSEQKIIEAAQKAVDKAKAKGAKSAEELENIGISALLKALGDPHTDYLDPAENRRLSEDIKGSFFGVGFMLRPSNGRPKVYSVIEGSPADKAGVKKNDIVMSVDGYNTKGKPLDTVVGRIRGKEGTQVVIKIKRGDETKERTFKITRKKIVIPDIETSVDGDMGIIKVFNYSNGISNKVRDEVRRMQQQGVKGFILDLRNNPGGLLDEAVNLASVFVKNGVVVAYQTKGQPRVELKASGNPETSLPLVVLTNIGSASSSEITAGALKDLGRAVLVGSKTYGKGSIQKMYELANQGAAKITISLYYLPNGESIDGTGITPDIEVGIKDAKRAQDIEREDKMQMDKAKEVLQNLIQGRPPTGEVLLPAA